MNLLFRSAIPAVLLAVALSAQTPAPPAAPVPEEIPRVRVSGRVVDAQTGLPAKGASVVIGERDLPASAETDFEGNFEIPGALAGEQQIHVSKSGYIDDYAGIRILAGRELSGVRIELQRSAVITGRLTAPGGSPLANAQVRVLRRTVSDGTVVYASGAAGMLGGGASSDDRGMFRAWGLQPGVYFVVVLPQPEPAPSGATVFPAAALYYPNASSLTEATRVEVGFGQIQDGIDLELGPPAETRVEGLVKIMEGGDCQNCTGEVHRREGDAWIGMGQIAISRECAFAIAGLNPGHYILAAHAYRMSTSSVNFGAAEFDVIDRRVTPLVVEAYGEQPVSGRIVLEDPPETVIGPEADGWRTTLMFRQQFGDPRSPPNMRGSFASISSKSAETAFELTPVAGRLALRLMPPPGRGYVRSMSIAGRPVEDRDITIPPGGLKDVVISVAFDTGSLAGRISGGETSAVEAGLMPKRRILWLTADGGHARFVENLTRSARPDGSFEVSGLPPGSYRVYAVTEEMGRLMGDPAVAEKLATWSKRVEVRAGQTSMRNLELAPSVSAPD
jgi:hypothetical protein